jgi:uncharacterized protein (TIGR02452 family)
MSGDNGSLLINTALEHAFNPAYPLQSHGFVVMSRTDRQLAVVQTPSSSQLKLSFSEIITLVEAQLPAWDLQKKESVNRPIQYMQASHLKKFSSLTRAIIELFEKIRHWFQGYGFITTHARAEILSTKITPLDARKVAPYANPTGSMELRRRAFQDTLRVCEFGGYLNSQGKFVPIDSSEMIKQTRIKGASHAHIDDSQGFFSSTSEGSSTQFQIVESDTLDHLLSLRDPKAIAVNFANGDYPGGGFLKGCGAQEEQLCGRSDYFKSLSLERYPLRELNCILSPRVTVFRTSEREGYQFMDRPQQVSLLASAAYDLREGSADRKLFNFPLSGPLTLEQCQEKQIYVEGVKSKIRVMLRIMRDNGYTTAILGAWGCGAFANPPQLVAQAFRDVFEEPDMKNVFKKINFAILGRENLDVFRKFLNF